MSEAPLKCIVSGAGPVGALAALYAGRRGWDVQVFERREDVRELSQKRPGASNDPAKSMELALSERSLHAIQESCSPALLEAVKRRTRHLRGRMVHGRDSNRALVEQEQLYDIHGHCLLAIDRVTLTELLLNELEQLPNVKLFFRHKITAVDLGEQTVRARDESLAARSCLRQPTPHETSQHSFDLLLGCDGAYSTVRASMMRSSRLDYSQTWVDIIWCQFTIPAATKGSYTTPSAKDGFSVSPNHLHIWPHNEMMYMAIPAADKSTVGTLFAPSSTFAKLERDPSSIQSFFKQYFPGAGELIGLESVQRQFERNAHEPLVSIKCSPHVYGSCAAILGDAAHAMVPFYGQGVNAGLEDVQVLFRCLNENTNQRKGLVRALECYNAERVADAHAINDLALSNYWEMRAGVRSRYRLMHKALEEFISRYAPFTGFVTQYSRVSFSNQRYSKIVSAMAVQRKRLARAVTAIIAPLMLLLAWMAWKTILCRAMVRYHG